MHLIRTELEPPEIVKRRKLEENSGEYIVYMATCGGREW